MYIKSYKKLYKKSCVACLPSKNKVHTITKSTTAQWLQNLGRQAIPDHTETFQNIKNTGFHVTSPSRCDLRIILTFHNVEEKHDLTNKLLYWASAPSDITNCTPKSAECAYGKYTNMGVSNSPSGKYKFTIDLRCPQPYLASLPGQTDLTLWCRHFHFISIKNKKYQHSNIVHTIGIYPSSVETPFVSYECISLFNPETSFHLPSLYLGFEKYLMAQSKNILCLNAVDHPDYPPISKKDIAISHESNNLKIKSLVDKALQSGKYHCDSKDILRTPLVVYCVKESCIAACNLLRKLQYIGYCNVFYFKHGMEEANKKLKGLTSC